MQRSQSGRGGAWDFALIAGIPTGKEDDWGIRYGLGLQAGITQNFTIRADWDRFELPVPGGEDNVDLLMLGVQWSFR